MNQNEFLNKIKTKVLKEDENASLILFGSRARGDYREDSDWDVLIITGKKADAGLKRRIRDDIFDVELEFTQAISTLIFDRDKWNYMSITPLYKNVAAEGKIL